MARRFNEHFSDFQAECQTIIIRKNETIVTTTQGFKDSLRKEKARKRRARIKNEIRLLPADIKALMRNVKVLKSITAYHRHGYRQWGTIARDIMRMPQIASPFLNVVLRTKDVNDKIDEIEQICKKGDKAVFQFVEKMTYQLDDLNKNLDNLLYGITKSGVLSSTMQNHECIVGSKDGKRLGLKTLVERGDKAISEIGRIINKLEEIAHKGVNPMDYTPNGK